MNISEKKLFQELLKALEVKDTMSGSIFIEYFAYSLNKLRLNFVLLIRSANQSINRSIDSSINTRINELNN